ncbi:hypothetical protein NDU88_006138 [Pleurodeles waltl]|uniref:BUD13 homolog n=1 Tax=Pleurodeles waltl TaxID=8319 RepID=A0AAV7UK56_PLEWA|nr:hypothetical protein NDU88_006138 [Pleurodeles waltl]
MAGAGGKTAAAALSKAQYLKRYLGGGAGGAEDGKKKRKKRYPMPGLSRSGGGRGMRIVDDDEEGWKEPAIKQENTVDEEEDLPVVAEFVDERPKEIKLMEEFRSGNKWKVLGDDHEDSQDSDRSLAVKSSASSESRSKSMETEGDCHSTKLSPLRRIRHDSPDSSPSRRTEEHCRDSPESSSPIKAPHDSAQLSPPRKRRHDSSDESPPRKGRLDSPDQSPPRRGFHDSSDQSPTRRRYHNSVHKSPARKGRHDSPDRSPPRRERWASPDIPQLKKGHHDSPDQSPPKKGRQSFPDLSRQRKDGHDSSDTSPPRRGQEASPDQLLSRKGRHDSPDLSPPSKGLRSSPDLSPPRKELPASSKRHKQRDDLPRLKGRRGHPGSDSDLSPPRKRGQSSVTRHGSDSDLSPPRRTLRNSSDSDLSPPRRATTTKGSPSRQRGETAQDNQMLSGGKAGLVVADVLRKEKLDSKRKERENKPLEEESRSAATVFRDKSGRKRDLQAEREEQQREAGVKSQKEEQYARWGQGLAQRQMQQQNVLDAAKEIEKPLARYIDDQDLDQMLREQERDGDPMANFIKKKKVKEEKNKKVRPRYSGPNPPPNRFDLWPGYRWDGVDRSNGFEQKRFARQADKKAVQEIAYKWSVEDM